MHGSGPGIVRWGGRAGSFGPFRLHQLVLCEIAGALLLCAGVVDPLLLAPASVAAALLVMLAVVRRHRRSLPALLHAVLALRAVTAGPRRRDRLPEPNRASRPWSSANRRCVHTRSGDATGDRSA